MIDFQTLVAGVFKTADAVAGIVKPASYIQITSSTYDAAAGNVTPTSTTIAINPILGAFSQKAMPSDYREGDKRILIRASELASLSGVSLDDTIVDGDNNKWAMVSIKLDPTKTIYIVHARASAT